MDDATIKDCTGYVASFQASGGEPTSHLFVFGVIDRTGNQTNFKLNPDAKPGIFAAMAQAAICAHFGRPTALVRCYSARQDEDGWMLSFIESPSGITLSQVVDE